MCDQDHFEDDLRDYEARGLVTRKQFGIMLGAGVAMLLPKVANAVTVVESEVNVKTPDGTADCYFVHPATGTAPGVVVWPDIFGLRQTFRVMGKRLAESGYSVLVVNPFYRLMKAPTASKGAALMLTRSIAVDYAAAGIRANAICPGMVYTPMTSWRLDQPALRAEVEDRIPIGRVADPAEIADAVALLASGRLGYMTGHPLVLDGGMSAL